MGGAGVVPRRVLLVPPQRCGYLLRRLAFQIWEEMYSSSGVVLVGVVRRGYVLAGHLARLVRYYSRKPVFLVSVDVRMGKIAGFEEEWLGYPWFLVDDVIHTGRTMVKAMGLLPIDRIEVLRTVVFVSREATRRFPVQPDLVGIGLATTWHEFVEVQVVPHLAVWLHQRGGEQ